MQENIRLFHFFGWSKLFGWQHLGATDGYNSYDECYEANKELIENRDKFKIMKLIETSPFKR